MSDSSPPTDTESVTTAGRLDDDACGAGVLGSRRVDEEAVADELAVFKALANEKRLRIVEALRGGELCVCELEAVLDAPQSTVASHLSKLRAVGVVRTRKDGKWTYYRIADTASLQLIDLARALGEEA